MLWARVIIAGMSRNYLFTYFFSYYPKAISGVVKGM